MSFKEIRQEINAFRSMKSPDSKLRGQFLIHVHHVFMIVFRQFSIMEGANSFNFSLAHFLGPYAYDW